MKQPMNMKSFPWMYEGLQSPIRYNSGIGIFGKRDNFLGDSSERSNWMYLRVGESEVWSVSFSFFHMTIRVPLSKSFAHPEALFS